MNRLKVYLQSARGKLISGTVSLMVIVALIFFAKTNYLKSRADTYPQGVAGVVTDNFGNPLSGVTVTDVATSQTVTSAADGSYRLTTPAQEIAVWFQKDGTPFNPGFSDVPASYWAAKYIGALKNAGIVSGYADGFRPLEEVTRAQMAVFLARAVAGSDANVPAATGQTFTDVPPGYWAYKYIEYLAKNSGISGYPDGSFKPEDKVTRAQMAVFITKVLNLPPTTKINQTFTDVKADYWAYSQIEQLAYLGVVSGYADRTYKPESRVTRDQMCVFIGKAFKNIILTQGGFAPRFEHFVITANEMAIFNLKMRPSGEVGVLKGTLKNAAKSPVAGAKIMLNIKPFSNESYAALTAANGSFAIYNLPEGVYPYLAADASGNTLSLNVSESHYEAVAEIVAGQTSTVNLVLK